MLWSCGGSRCCGRGCGRDCSGSLVRQRCSQGLCRSRRRCGDGDLFACADGCLFEQRLAVRNRLSRREGHHAALKLSTQGAQLRIVGIGMPGTLRPRDAHRFRRTGGRIPPNLGRRAKSRLRCRLRGRLERKLYRRARGGPRLQAGLHRGLGEELPRRLASRPQGGLFGFYGYRLDFLPPALLHGTFGKSFLALASGKRRFLIGVFANRSLHGLRCTLAVQNLRGMICGFPCLARRLGFRGERRVILPGRRSGLARRLDEGPLVRRLLRRGDAR